jgi:hypothetical protein
MCHQATYPSYSLHVRRHNEELLLSASPSARVVRRLETSRISLGRGHLLFWRFHVRAFPLHIYTDIYETCIRIFRRSSPRSYGERFSPYDVERLPEVDLSAHTGVHESRSLLPTLPKQSFADTRRLCWKSSRETREAAAIVC